MKAVHYLFIVSIALPACEKTNDVARLRDEATTVAKFYQPKLDELNHRIEMIFQRGKTIPAGLPAIKDVSQVLERARSKLLELRKAAMPAANGRSSIEAEADTAAKAGNTADLERIVDDAEETLGAGTTEVNDELTTVESWISLAQASASKAPAVPPPEPASPSTPAR